MRAIQYAAPESIRDAVALLNQFGARARVLAGGTDLIVQLREYLREIDVVVDSKQIPELMELRFELDGSLILGAAVPCCRIYEDERVQRTFPGLVDAARIVGSTAIQGRASVGGKAVLISNGTFAVSRSQMQGSTAGWRWFYNTVHVARPGRYTVSGSFRMNGVTFTRSAVLVVSI